MFLFFFLPSINFFLLTKKDTIKKRKFSPFDEPENHFDIPKEAPVIDPNFYELSLEDEERVKIKSPMLTDITALLNLSQKTASLILGMSESMLCKKFKEITNKKWPYRQIQKIEKEIEQCKDESQLKILYNKRKQFFTPVSIYVKRFYTQKEAEMLFSDKRIN